MKKAMLMALLLTGSTTMMAQKWDVLMNNGVSLGKLLPMESSTPASKYVHYGFNKPGLVFSPEVRIRTSEHSQVSIAYEYSASSLGVHVRIGGTPIDGATTYDKINLHDLSVGYHYNRLTLHEKMQIGFFGKVGIAYGYMTELGGGGSAGGGSDPLTYTGSSRTTGFEVMPNFWTPTTTLGVMAGPHVKNPHIGDRLSFFASAKICWKDPYTGYTKLEYSQATNSQAQSGTIQFKGMPFMLQTGVTYRLFHMGKKTS